MRITSRTRIFSLLLATAMLTAPPLAAQADWHGGDGGGGGGQFFGGALLGLGIGALMGGALSQPGYAPPPPAYYPPPPPAYYAPPPPVYYAPPPGYYAPQQGGYYHN